MKIVIDIEGYDREWITNGYHIPDEINGKIAEAIIDGTPLPEEHGDLIDRNKIGLTDFDILLCNNDYKEALKLYAQSVEDAPTIIEGE